MPKLVYIQPGFVHDKHKQMKTLPFLGGVLIPLAIVLTSFFQNTTPSADIGWMQLINGKDMSGWKASENKETWSVTPEGYLQAVGKRSHLFYEGEHLKSGFKNFEFEAQVRTFKLANSGIYFHTKYQESGWPGQGIEIQVNNSHIGEGEYIELKRMGSLYGVRNVYKTFAQDDEWMTVKARVDNDRVQIWVNGIKTVDYVQSERRMGGIKKLSTGTFCLQGHDPLSKMQYRSFKVRRLPDNSSSNLAPLTYAPWQDSLLKYQGQQFAFIDLNPNANLSPEDLAKYTYTTGINVALLKSPKEAKALAGAKKLPLFTGIKVNIETLASLKANTADYVIGESTGLESARALLNSQKIKVWSDKGQDLNTDQADALMDLAKQNNVAIEIDNISKSPAIAVLRKAKAKGCKFSFAGLVPADKLTQSLYVIEAIKGAKLSYKDQYVPKW